MMMRRTKHDPNKGGSLQMSFFAPDCDWRPTPLVDLPSWSGAKRIAIDSETNDPSIRNKLGTGQQRDGYTVGWGFAIDGGPKHYLPFRHEGGDNLPVEGALGYLREQVKNFKGEYVGANLAYDVDYGYCDDFKWHPEAKFRDIQIADPLIYELHFSYSLKAIGERNGVEAKDETILEQAAEAYGLHPKGGLWRLPARFVGGYGEQDVASPLEILAIQEKKIEELNLQQVWDLETDVLPVLVRMRRRGVRIDFDKLDQIEKWALSEEEKAAAEIKDMTGVNIGIGNVWKKDVIAPALISMGMKFNKTSTGAPQIDKILLGSSDHPVPAAILHARKVNKIRTTFAASIRRYAVNGRIHCQFNQIAREDESGDQKGVRYGRLSAVDPNLQQQPSPDRDPIVAGEWRKVFIPEEKAIWGCSDYSQQEPRWTTHFAAQMDFPGAAEAAKRYRDDPTTDNHDMMTRIVNGDVIVDKWFAEDPKGIYKVERGFSKAIYLGLCYGEGGAKLCRDINKPTRWAHISGWGQRRHLEYFSLKMDAMSARMDAGTGYVKEMAGEEGQEILDKFDREAPFVGKIAEAATKRAEANGFVKTILGRRLHFEQREDGSYNYTHKALNRVIQGSSADQTKLALIEIDKTDAFLQLQVHDDTNGSYGSVAEAKIVGDIMRDCILQRCSPLVPFNVDTETGTSWGDLK